MKGGATRILHAAVFFGLAAIALTVCLPELHQLFIGLRGPYHFGAPPSPLALLSAVLVLSGVGAMLVALLRGRPVALRTSACILVGFVTALAAAGTSSTQGRSVPSANREILLAAGQLQRQMIERLQKQGSVPTAPAEWAQALQRHPPSPVRDRSFQRLPFLLTQDSPAARPGALLLSVTPDGASFELTPYGFTQSGSAGPLRDEAGEVLVLRGLFNPDL